MSLFNNILDQITKSLQNKENYKEDIVKEINNIIGIKISSDQIRIKDNKIFFSVSPTIKTVIFLKKNQLITVLKKYKIESIV